MLPIGRGSSTCARHVALRAFQLGEHAADVRMLDAALEQAAGLHHLVAGIVDRGGGVIDAADQRELVGVLRHAREILRDLDARDVGLDRLVRPADFGRRVRLHVPGVELGRPADQEQHDAVDVIVGRGAERAQAEPVGEAEAEDGERAGVQEIAPPQAVAKFDRRSASRRNTAILLGVDSITGGGGEGRAR